MFYGMSVRLESLDNNILALYLRQNAMFYSRFAMVYYDGYDEDATRTP